MYVRYLSKRQLLLIIDIDNRTVGLLLVLNTFNIDEKRETNDKSIPFTAIVYILIIQPYIFSGYPFPSSAAKLLVIAVADHP